VYKNDTTCSEAIGKLLGRIERKDLIHLCIRYSTCIYCGGDLVIAKEFEQDCRMECTNCGGEFFKRKICDGKFSEFAKETL
jgi:hypothetical protein